MTGTDYTFYKNDQKISGRMYFPEEKYKIREKYPLVIFSHGLGSNFRELEHYGPILAQEGIACFLFDFCGGGPECISSGSFEDMSVQTEIDDLNSVLTNLKMLPYIDSQNIFLMGESQGGYVSACVAADRQQDVAGLILWYPAFVIEDDAKKRIGLATPDRYDFFGLRLGERYIQDALKIQIYKKISAYKKKVLIIHGDRDELVPLSASEKAVQIYESAELKVIPGGGHGFEGADRYKAAGYAISFIKNFMTP